jgi:hypothetical protein
MNNSDDINDILNQQIEHLKSKLVDYYLNNDQFIAFNLDLCRKYLIDIGTYINIDIEIKFNKYINDMNKIINNYGIYKKKIISKFTKIVNKEEKFHIINSLDNNSKDGTLKYVLNSFFNQFPKELSEIFILLNKFILSNEEQLFKENNFENMKWYMINLGNMNLFLYISLYQYLIIYSISNYISILYLIISITISLFVCIVLQICSYQGYTLNNETMLLISKEPNKINQTIHSLLNERDCFIPSESLDDNIDNQLPSNTRNNNSPFVNALIIGITIGCTASHILIKTL